MNLVLANKLVYSDTIAFWHFYINDIVIFKQNVEIWHDSSGKILPNNKVPELIAKIDKYDINKDSIGLLFFEDIYFPYDKFFYIKNENDSLICKLKVGRFPSRPDYIHLQNLFYSPQKNKPLILKIYYISPWDHQNFPDEKERLLGIIEFK